MFRKLFETVKGLVLKEGTTPFGKAVEHAAVAGVSVAVMMLITASFKGNLDLDAVSTAVVAGGTTALAGIRAYLKKAAQG